MLRILVPVVLLMFTSCTAEQKPQTDAQTPTQGEAPNQDTTKTPAGEQTPAGKQTPAPAGGATAAGSEVVETMNSGGYTYAKLDEGGKHVWYAVRECEVAVGDRVTMSADRLPQHNFKSATLGRTFDTIYFCGSLIKNGAGASGISPEAEDFVKEVHAGASKSPSPKVEADSIKKPEDGLTVTEIWAQGRAGDAVGKEITFRAKVVKYNAQIMGLNFLHVQDGTGTAEAKDNDITVTTTDTAKKGDTVLIKGTLVAGKDFGAGYKYELIVQEAKVTVE